MMDDVVINNVMEKMTAKEPKAAIHCPESTFLEGPSGRIVVWDFRMSVVKKGKCN